MSPALGLTRRVMELEIFHCNRTYSAAWLDEKKMSNGIQYLVIEDIFDLIRIRRGGAITQKELIEHSESFRGYIAKRPFRATPSSGTEMIGNGRGIHHAKFGPAKNVAVLWCVIRGIIHVTFDDHAPIKYHRAIYCFHQIRLGRPVTPRSSRCSPKMREILSSKTPWIYKGINPRDRHYYTK